MRVFAESVEQDGEFAHDGGERDFGGFAVVAQAGIEGLEDRVVADGGERGHLVSPMKNKPNQPLANPDKSGWL